MKRLDPLAVDALFREQVENRNEFEAKVLSEPEMPGPFFRPSPYYEAVCKERAMLKAKTVKGTSLLQASKEALEEAPLQHLKGLGLDCTGAMVIAKALPMMPLLLKAMTESWHIERACELVSCLGMLDFNDNCITQGGMAALAEAKGRRPALCMQVEESDEGSGARVRGGGVAGARPRVLALPPQSSPFTGKLTCLGRHADLKWLEEQLPPGQRAMACVVGMSGIGKSTLALAFAHKHMKAYPGLVYWVGGSGGQGVRAGLLELAVRLGVEPEGGGGGGGDRQQAMLDALRCALETRADLTPALLVLDDVREDAEQFERWLPVVGATHVLVTTQSCLGMGTAPVRKLQPLEKEAALELAGGGRKWVGPEEGALAWVCELVGHHPLALAVVGALVERKVPSLLQQQLLECQARNTRGWHAGELYFDMLFDASLAAGPNSTGVEEGTRRLAVRMAVAAGWYAPDKGVRLELLQAAAVRVGVDEPAEEGSLSSLCVPAAALLVQVRLAAWDDHNCLRFHDLVQLYMRHKGGERGGRAAAAALVVRGEVGADAPHMAAVCLAVLGEPRGQGGGGGQLRLLGEEMPKFAERVVAPLVEHELKGLRFNNAVRLAEAGVTALEQEGGRSKGLVLGLCRLRNFWGHWAEAAQEQWAVMSYLQQRVLGFEDANTLDSCCSLTDTLKHMGQHAEAAQEHRVALKMRQLLLGSEDANTFVRRRSLENMLKQMGQHAEAMQEHRAVLEARQRLLGPETLSSRYNLALALSKMVQHAEFAEELRTVRQRVLGLEHLDTLSSQYNLALEEEHLKKTKELEPIKLLDLELQLYSNHVGEVRYFRLMKATLLLALELAPLQHLEVLGLGDNGIGCTGATEIAKAPMLVLKTMNESHNGRAHAALSPLEMNDSCITQCGMAALAEAKGGRLAPHMQMDESDEEHVENRKALEPKVLEPEMLALALLSLYSKADCKERTRFEGLIAKAVKGTSRIQLPDCLHVVEGPCGEKLNWQVLADWIRENGVLPTLQGILEDARLHAAGEFMESLWLFAHGRHSCSGVFDVVTLAKAISAAGPLVKLQELTLIELSMGSTGAKRIAEVLCELPNLKSFELWQNAIGNDGACSLAKALEQAPLQHLEVLGLGDNGIGCTGAAAIAKVLPTMSVLKTVLLNLNVIRDKGAVAIARALEELPELEVLDLSDNYITQRGVAAFDEARSCRAAVQVLVGEPDEGA